MPPRRTQGIPAAVDRHPDQPGLHRLRVVPGDPPFSRKEAEESLLHDILRIRQAVGIMKRDAEEHRAVCLNNLFGGFVRIGIG